MKITTPDGIVIEFEKGETQEALEAALRYRAQTITATAPTIAPEIEGDEEEEEDEGVDEDFNVLFPPKDDEETEEAAASVLEDRVARANAGKVVTKSPVTLKSAAAAALRQRAKSTLTPPKFKVYEWLVTHDEPEGIHIDAIREGCNLSSKSAAGQAVRILVQKKLAVQMTVPGSDPERPRPGFYRARTH